MNTIRTLSPYLGRSSFSRNSWKRAQVGHWRSAYSTIVTGALAGPTLGWFRVTIRRSTSLSFSNGKTFPRMPIFESRVSHTSPVCLLVPRLAVRVDLKNSGNADLVKGPTVSSVPGASLDVRRTWRSISALGSEATAKRFPKTR